MNNFPLKNGNFDIHLTAERSAMRHKHEIDLLKGEKYNISTIPFERVSEFTRAIPGIYSWYIRPKPGRESDILPLASDLARQNDLKATLEGNLRLSYAGTLKKVIENPIIEDPELARAIYITVPYPLYVGISTNLKTRLRTHVKQLHKCMEISDTKNFPTEMGDADSDEESRYFAGRVAKLFLSAGVKALDCLYLRVFEYTKYGESDSISRHQKIIVRRKLMQAETLANNLFNPVFGRK